jgi:hypothetical protein
LPSAVAFRSEKKYVATSESHRLASAVPAGAALQPALQAPSASGDVVGVVKGA